MSRALILCGFKGCGKTTYGKRLAARLSWPFVDLDDVCVTKYAQQYSERLSPREISLKHGEGLFRELEQEVVSELPTSQQLVVATGGGTVLDPTNVELLKLVGLLVYIDVEKQILYERLIRGPWPSFLDVSNKATSFDIMHAERLGIYQNISDIRLSTKNRSEDEVLLELISIATEMKMEIHGK